MSDCRRLSLAVVSPCSAFSSFASRKSSPRFGVLLPGLIVLTGLLLPAVTPAQTLIPNWVQLSPATSPTGRGNSAMAYDAAHGQIVLFGGYSGPGAYLGDTWIWDGATWTQKSPATSPSGRSNSAMAYDAVHGLFVLFGGDNFGGYLSDTWVWDGTNWTQRNPATSPPSRYGHAMAYDAAHSQVVLFGGRNSGGYLSDTWFWNGTTWIQANPAISPTGRYNATMAYDAASGQTVLFGGFGGSYLNDTWAWDGSNWTHESPATSPGARFASVMAYDAASGQMVLFGGLSSGALYLSDTWIWDGSNWSQANPVTTPPARDYAAMTYDAASGQMVLFAGNDSSGFLDDTWTLQLGPVNLGSANVCPSGSTTPSPCSQTATLWFDVAANTTIGSIQVLTQGAAGLDFTATTPDTSTTLCTAKTYTAATTCSVDVTFSPKYPGQRLGAVQLLNTAGTAALATANPYGQGVGGQAAFPPAIINTAAGKGSWMSPPSFSGDGGLAIDANLWGPGGTALDGAGNLYIADTGNFRVRKVDAAGNISTVAGNGSDNHSGDGSAAINAAIGSPSSVALDGAGNLYIGDSGNSLVRKVNAAGIISTVAGNASLGYSGDGGLAIHAEFCSANSLALDGAGNLYIDDGCFNTIRKVDAATGIIRTVAGEYNNGNPGYSGDGGSATSARLYSPLGLALDAAGNMYITDSGNNRIRKVDAATGIISTVAGTGSSRPHSGDGVLALQANLNYPQGMALDAEGNLYLADTYYNCIRKVNAQNGAVSASSTLSTVAGTCNTSGNFSGDGGAATSAKLSNAQDITLDAAGNLYITDAGNNRIREVSAATPPTLNFTATDVGLASSDSPKTVTLENTGNGDLTFPIPSTGYNPSIAAGFTLDSTVSNACPLVSSSLQAAATLAAGDSCILSMSFAPVAAGLDNGSLTLIDNSAPGSQAITLQGTGNTVTLTANAGSGQSAVINTAFGTALSANVQDGSGNPVANEVVTFTAPASGASGTFASGLITATATTGSNGVATASAFTANATGGSYTVTATLDSLSASFNLSNLVPPTVTVVSPSSGPTAGGTAVTITGTNFTGATGVTIGGVAATSVVVVSGTSITAVTPAGTAGTASVVVTTPGGSNAANTLFTYVAPPTISKTFSPTSIAVGGTSTLTFTITNPNTVTTLTGVAFTDTFPSGLQWSINTGGTVTGDCGTKTITLIANTYVDLDGATISAGGSCTFSVNVTGITAGVKNNTTGNVSSTNGGMGNTASASLTVEYQLATAANPAAGGMVLPASGGLYSPGTVVLLTATPAPGYTFAGWTSAADPVASATSANTTIPMNANETVTANFTPTLVVNTPNDDSGSAANCTPQATPGANTVDAACSLRDALLFAANAGSANISFDSTKFAATNTASQNTINLSLSNGTLMIPSNTSITGATSGSGATLTNLVTVAGGGLSSDFSVFTVNSGVTGAAINNLTITKGNTLSNGGGINNTGALTVSNSTVSGNSCMVNGDGCGIFNYGTMTVSNSTVSGNTSMGGGDGGGIYNGGTLMVINSTVSSNTSVIGGGIYNSSTLTVTNSTVSGNTAEALGGGIFNSYGTLTVSNSTFAGNSAASYGGGIDNNSGTLTVSNSTFSGNSTPGSGGGIYNIGGTLILANTIAAGNTAGSGPDVFGTAIDDGYNLIGNGTGSTGLTNGVKGTQVGNSANPLNPQLAQLANYGGPTQTMLPQPGSPAICAGTSTPSGGLTLPATDQRGFGFDSTYCPSGYVDAGAVQTNYALSFTTEPGASQVAGVPFTAVVTLTESASPVNGVTIPLTLNGGGTLSGGSASTNSSGVASYTLSVASSTALSGLTLTATLPSPPTLTPTSTSFNLSEPLPTVTGISPSSGPTAGGTPVTITGTNFTGATAVDFGTTAATNVVIVNSTTITAITPVGVGTVDVTVTTPSGTSAISPVDQFTYIAPTATSLTPTVTPNSTFVYSLQPSISVALAPSNAAGIGASDFTATLDSSTVLTVTAGTGNSFNIALPATPLTVGAHSIAVNFTGTPFYLASSATIALTVTTPNLVVTTNDDDAGTASNCTAQTTPGTGTDASCSLRDALLVAANAGSANISFDSTKFAATNTVAQNTINLSHGTLNIPSNTSITGETSGSGATLTNLVTVAGGGSSSNFSVFNVNSGVTGAAINNLNITNGHTSGSSVGGGITNIGALTVSNSTFSGNSADFGGGILNGSTLTVINSTVSGNSATQQGGGIYNAVLVRISNSTFSGNTAAAGGGIYNTGRMTISNSTFSGNTASGNGGGISNDFGSTIAIKNSTFSGNSSGAVGGINNGGGTIYLANGLIADSTTGNSIDDYGGNVFAGVNGVTTGSINLSLLGNYGGPTQTMMPLPGSTAICAGTASPTDLTLPSTDQRGTGFLRTNSTYPGYSSGTPCVDAGAVQTDYSLAFVQQPSTVVQNAAMLPTPTIQLDESGVAFADGTDTIVIPLSLTTGSGTLTGGSVSTSATTGVATYSSLSISLPGTSDVLTAKLTLNSATTPETAISIASNPFNVNSAVAQLAYNPAPALTLTAGGNAGSVTVDEENSGGTLVTTASDTVTLTVTGPGSYSKSYTATAINGVVAFDLSSAALTAAGSYSYTASIAGNSTVTAANAPELVSAASAASVTVVSGTPQSATIGTALAVALKVKVTDQYGNPVQGASVSFSAPSSGASATFTGSPAATAADGTASVTATANGLAGMAAYTVTASVNGAGTTASFLLTNTQASTTLTVTPVPTAIVYGQSTTINAAITPSSVLTSSPTGTMTFYDGSTALTPASTVASASASYTVSVPVVGSHTYAAQYGGDNNFAQSSLTAATSAVVVGKANSTLNGPSLPTNLTYGVGGSINISVAGQYSGAGIATPSGSVSYTIGSGTAQTATIAAGTATLTVPASQTAGTYTVTVSYLGDGNYNGATPITVNLAITKATATVTLGSLAQTYTGSALSATATTTPANLTVTFTYNGQTVPPTAAGTYTVVGTVSDPNYQGTATGTLTISKATATVTLGSLSQTYTGAAISATATTTPANLTVTFTYNGLTALPTAAGTYTVVGTVSDPNYQGTATGTLTISKATATVTLGNLAQTYTGSALSATATTTPANLAVTFTYNGQTAPPTAAGTYTVVGTVSDPNYQGTATSTLSISKATATVTLGGLAQTYTGSALSATATTTPANLTVTFTYNGLTALPTAAGTYTVVGTVSDPNYQGSATGTLTISKATAAVTLGGLAQTYTGSALSATAATTPANLTVTFTYNGQTVPPTAAGTYTVVGTVSDPNYQGTATGTLSISKATATVTLGSLSQTYTGSALTATATTTPANLTVTFTYNGSAAAPTAAGTYTVVGTVGDPNYQGTATGTLVISKATAAVTLGGLAQTYTGSALSATATTPANLTVTFTYNGLTALPTAAGTYTVVGTVSDPNYQGTATGTMTINKATPTVTWATPAAITYGTALSGTQLDASASGVTGASLAGTFTYSPLSGTVLTAGSQTLSVSFVPNDTTDYTSLTATTVQLQVNKANATINVTPYTVTYDGNAHTANGTATGVGGINLAADLTLSGTTHTNTGTYATDSWSFTDPNGNYASASGTVSDTINQASQTITFPVALNPSTPVVTTYTYSVGGSFTLKASTSSGLAASFASLNGGVCTVSGITAYIVTAGTCIIQATQTGNTNYSAATPVSANYTISQASQTITYSPTVTSYPYSSGGTFNLSASSSSGLTISFASLSSGVCTVTGTTAYIVTGGTCTIQATQTGNVDYSAATPVSVNYTISQATPTITLVSSMNPILLQNQVNYTATVSSKAGLPTGTVTFSDGGTVITACASTAVTVSNGQANCAVTYTVTGTHNITAVYSGDTNFLAAGPSNTVSEAAIDINLGTLTTSETILPGGTATYSFLIAPSSGTTFPSPVTFTVTSSPALPSGTTITLTPQAWVFTSNNPWSWTLPANTSLPSNTVLTIQLPQATASAQNADGKGGNLVSRLAPFSLALLLLPFAGRLRRTGKRLGRMMCALLLLAAGMAAVAGMSGCGSTSGFFAQTQQSYTVTVTVSSGSLSHTSNLTLTVE